MYSCYVHNWASRDQICPSCAVLEAFSFDDLSIKKDNKQEEFLRELADKQAIIIGQRKEIEQLQQEVKRLEAAYEDIYSQLTNSLNENHDYKTQYLLNSFYELPEEYQKLIMNLMGILKKA